jgi:L-alanine-DL-glutamate epimerase-like enolase superfamily enzyme
VKLGKSSGLLNAKKIIAIAEKAKMKMQVGAFMESRLGITAAAHLALCSKNIIYCDFDTPLMFTTDPVIGGINYRDKGIVEMPVTHGLGASIDDTILDKLEKVII